jgi:hypothetical protein
MPCRNQCCHFAFAEVTMSRPAFANALFAAVFCLFTNKVEK